jgi:hypothetical protein
MKPVPETALQYPSSGGLSRRVAVVIGSPIAEYGKAVASLTASWVDGLKYLQVLWRLKAVHGKGAPVAPLIGGDEDDGSHHA